MKKYIKATNESIKKTFKQHHLFDKPVYVLKDLENVNLEDVLNKIENIIPAVIADNIDNIYVGEFKDFSRDNLHFNAVYKDGTIYVSNKQDNEKDMVDDIVHEIAHSLEANNEETIYGDEALEKEFLAKRNYLYHHIPEDKKTYRVLFINPEYDSVFDDYLYNFLGYDLLGPLTSEYFYSPYGITSLREYWANGFENYFLGDRQKLKDISPILYTRIKSLIESEEEKTYEI